MRWVVGALTTATALLVLSGCGSTGSTQADSSSHHSTTTPVPALLRVQSLSVRGHTLRVLETAKGYTLYYYTKDQPTKMACNNAACHAFWSPLTAKSVPTHLPGTPGRLSLFDGQVEYNGHPLYTYIGDKPGTANGEGIQNAWYVATPNLPQSGSTIGGNHGSWGSGGPSHSPTKTPLTSPNTTSAGNSGW